MPGTLQRIRNSMTVKTSPRDKGLVLTIKVVAYDNGMVEVDGIPINESPRYDRGQGWLGAAEMVVATLGEFRRQADKRIQNARTLIAHGRRAGCGRRSGQVSTPSSH